LIVKIFSKVYQVSKINPTKKPTDYSIGFLKIASLRYVHNDELNMLLVAA
jgi:hypothetical protein